jgi:hypothetical protein
MAVFLVRRSLMRRKLDISISLPSRRSCETEVFVIRL